MITLTTYLLMLTIILITGALVYIPIHLCFKTFKSHLLQETIKMKLILKLSLLSLLLIALYLVTEIWIILIPTIMIWEYGFFLGMTHTGAEII